LAYGDKTSGWVRGEEDLLYCRTQTKGYFNIILYTRTYQSHHYIIIIIPGILWVYYRRLRYVCLATVVYDIPDVYIYAVCVLRSLLLLIGYACEIVATLMTHNNIIHISVYYWFAILYSPRPVVTKQLYERAVH